MDSASDLASPSTCRLHRPSVTEESERSLGARLKIFEPETTAVLRAWLNRWLLLICVANAIAGLLNAVAKKLDRSGPTHVAFSMVLVATMTTLAVPCFLSFDVPSLRLCLRQPVCWYLIGASLLNQVPCKACRLCCPCCRHRCRRPQSPPSPL